MRLSLISAITALTILTLAHTVAATEDAVRIGVIDLTSENVDPSELRVLSDRLRAELFNTGEFTVLEREKMDVILNEQGFQQSGCVAYECVVEIGQLLGMEKIVAGNVGKVGDVYTLSLRMVDVETGALERTALRDCECALQDILTGIIGQVAAELAGTSWSGSAPVQSIGGEFGTGILYVESTPSGGRIYIDGKPSRDSTPAMLRDIPSGEHVVRVIRENLVAEERVRIEQDDLFKLNLTLGPEYGVLFIESQPLGAMISIDDRPRGTAPALLRDVPTGPHTIRVTAEGYVPWEEQIVVEFNDRTELPITLQPAGYITVSPDKLNATVTIDGRQIDKNQLQRFPVSVGEHRIRVTLAEYIPVEYDISVTAGHTSTIRAVLIPVFGQVRVVSFPPGATVSSSPAGIDGTTPYTNNHIHSGRYVVTVSMPDYSSFNDTVEVAGVAISVYARLTRSEEYLERIEAERRISISRQHTIIEHGLHVIAIAAVCIVGAVLWII
jgi:hypothetical protein